MQKCPTGITRLLEVESIATNTFYRGRFGLARIRSGLNEIYTGVRYFFYELVLTPHWQVEHLPLNHKLVFQVCPFHSVLLVAI